MLDLGHRRRRRDRRVRDLPRARRAHDRHLRAATEKLERRASWGADVAVNHHDGDVVAAVKEATGKGVDVVVETVGEATWARSLAAVRPAGQGRRLRRHERPEPAGGAAPLLVEAARRARLDDGDARGLPRRLRPRPLAAAPACTSTASFPLAEIAAAHERLEAGEQLGKIVLQLPDGG